MDLIFTNAKREDQGVLQDYDLDLAFGADENNFECTVPASAHCCEAGSVLYMEGTEYGGIVDSIESDTKNKEVKYMGRTWHGILGSKVILPLQEDDHFELEPGTARLPGNYSEVLYIESTGTQYFDTGFIPNQDTRVVLDVENTANRNGTYFGSRQAFKKQAFSIFLLTPDSFRDDYGASVISGSFDMIGRHVVDKNKNITTIDDIVIEHDAQTFTAPGNLLLLASNTAGNVDSNARARVRLYSCQIYDNGTLVRDFVPCFDENRTVGLYDLVNDVFYRNAGSGSFAAGDKIETEYAISKGVAIRIFDAEGNHNAGKYLIISGDANNCIGFILDRCGLSDLFSTPSDALGVNIDHYQFHRFTDAYSGLLKMLSSAGLKLNTQVCDGRVVLSAEAKYDYSQDEEFDSDQVEFQVKKKYKAVNHLICLGSGELENRMVIHLYADTEGNISQKQTQFGENEYAAVYDYSSVESEEELISGGTEELKELWEPDKLSVDFDDTSDNYDVGDTVGAFDNITGISVAAVITKKIVTIKNGRITISYKVGD